MENGMNKVFDVARKVLNSIAAMIAGVILMVVFVVTAFGMIATTIYKFLEGRKRG
jgi:cytochrome c biogenesis protein CcdA